MKLIPYILFSVLLTAGPCAVASGSTQKRATHTAVPGAAYSSWVLWNWVNGDIVTELQQLTEKVYP